MALAPSLAPGSCGKSSGDRATPGADQLRAISAFLCRFSVRCQPVRWASTEVFIIPSEQEGRQAASDYPIFTVAFEL